ncbi:hypothetical protein BGZ65_009361, partial [Modicella reniformis]
MSRQGATSIHTTTTTTQDQLDQDQNENLDPFVLIVGAGLGGLLLAALLERINISYHIYERATEWRAYGAAMTLGANVLPIFEQLGLLEEIEQISLQLGGLDLYNRDMLKMGSVGRTDAKEA